MEKLGIDLLLLDRALLGPQHSLFRAELSGTYAATAGMPRRRVAIVRIMMARIYARFCEDACADGLCSGNKTYKLCNWTELVYLHRQLELHSLMCIPCRHLGVACGNHRTERLLYRGNLGWNDRILSPLRLKISKS
jgi:hypothetical protein